MKYRGKTITYKQGGMADFTGLAWLDGTKAKPERVLSSYQTELFEDLLASLHDIRVRAPAVAAIPSVEKQTNPAFHIDTIQVTVERLENDSDYEEMARRVGKTLFEEITRGTAVGGFRLSK